MNVKNKALKDDETDEDFIRLLLVEDDEDDYILAEDYLKEAYGKDIEITWAKNFDKAIELISSHTFDIFLIDYMLGEKTGIELTKEITSNTFVVNAVILLTGMDNREVDIEATKSGAMDYLVKQELNASLLERSIRYALKRKRIEEKLIALAQHDPLTGLANRTKFNLALSDKIQQARRDNNQFAVLLLDLDNFKEVNDTLGHSTGDSLLKITAKRLNESLRGIDMIARLGGDEFSIIAQFNHIGQGSAQIAERLIQELSVAAELDYHQIKTGVSIGIAIYPHDGVTPEALLKSADLAMYKSKRGGRGTFRYYDPEFELELTQTKKLHDELQLAIDSEQFELFFQPIIDTQTNRVIKAEALIRWNHPSKGLVGPGEFIEAAEKNSMILTIGRWVLNEAFKQCINWQNEPHMREVGVAINLSPHQFHDEELLKNVTKAISRSGLEERYITLEITETTLMEVGSVVVDRLNALAELGLDLAIDDFGTGYSSLAYLKRFPVSTLKVDRSFISDIETDDDDKVITNAIINLGNSLNKRVIAEGIETATQLTTVNEFGCHLIQGYLFAKPMPLKDFSIWVHKYHQHKD
ncbi:EAL domain-containing protein [Pleionea litopenaei]|uniref:EAL domain-containing protein n=1 Tax=Pleionea litopenaei TaxID=3070815 RepID=A0AA51RQV7_9GAMM|nr:EAL domain-containing protein [Pleionea sp. HL-JVS1]WMS85859.1 EAL domain-containing protein [Pleionea sp. HL-JVS1]